LRLAALELAACRSKNTLMEEQDNDRSPLFPKWSYWYALVIGFLLLLIIFFSFFTKYFA
jgi:hypothetical protein